MKGHLMALSLACALAFLCACGQQAEQPRVGSGALSQPPSMETRKPLPEQQKEVTVTEFIGEEGETTSSDGFSYKYSFHLPQIEDDTADAAGINQEIASTYGEIAKECLESVQKKEAPYCSSVEYESFHSGDVLSLVLKCAYFYDGGSRLTGRIAARPAAYLRDNPVGERCHGQTGARIPRAPRPGHHLEILHSSRSAVIAAGREFTGGEPYRKTRKRGRNQPPLKKLEIC